MLDHGGLSRWSNGIRTSSTPKCRDTSTFCKDGLGEFQFGYVRCDIDWRESERDGEPAVEFSFEGMDEMGPCLGRGRAAVQDGTLDGMIYFHRGDESGFTAKKEKRA